MLVGLSVCPECWFRVKMSLGYLEHMCMNFGLNCTISKRVIPNNVGHPPDFVITALVNMLNLESTLFL